MKVKQRSASAKAVYSYTCNKMTLQQFNRLRNLKVKRGSADHVVNLHIKLDYETNP